MKLHLAMTLAERIQRELAVFCLRCEIVGSIRRARPEVGDIDLVILPKVSTSPRPMVEQIKARCKERCRVTTDGRQNFICEMKIGGAAGTAFQLDIFFAHNGVDDLLNPQPTNFGSLLLCRTGSKEHNIMLCARAKSMDMHWNPYQGLFAGGMWELDGQTSTYKGGTLIASETEEKIYSALGMKWVSPALREANAPKGPSIEEILSQGNKDLNASQQINGATP